MNTGEQKLCLRLKSLRKKAGLSRSRLEKEAGIAMHHIKALEECKYDDLPEGSARRALIKSYARAVNIDFSIIEESIEQAIPKTNIEKPKVIKTRRFTLSIPNMLRSTMFAGIVGLLIVYLGFEVHAMVGPPELNVAFPTQNHETFVNEIEVTGKTAPESIVTINGLRTTLNRNGDFTETIHLKEGLNEIIVISEAKRGGQASVTRTVLFQPETKQATLTTQTRL